MPSFYLSLLPKFSSTSVPPYTSITTTLAQTYRHTCAMDAHYRPQVDGATLQTTWYIPRVEQEVPETGCCQHRQSSPTPVPTSAPGVVYCGPVSVNNYTCALQEQQQQYTASLLDTFASLSLILYLKLLS